MEGYEDTGRSIYSGMESGKAAEWRGLEKMGKERRRVIIINDEEGAKAGHSITSCGTVEASMEIPQTWHTI